ncbi:unnamed protein product, partial [Phaeothamnion confervicola]
PRCHVPVLTVSRSFAKAKKGGKKGADEEDADAAAGSEEAAAPDTLPLNHLKDGQDPKILPTDQYPEWLWNLTLPSLNELERKGYNNLTLREERRYWRIKTVRKIKENNADKSF